jgi:hypothetical protein
MSNISLNIKDAKIIKGNKNEEYRLNFCYGFIGTNRTGKSSVAKLIATEWRKNNPDYTIVSHDPQDNFSEITDYFINPEDKDWANKCLKLRNALIILDDVRLINQSNTPIDGLMKLLYYRAKYNIDIIHICHNPSLLLNAFAHFTNRYFIFFTNSQEGSFQKKLPNYTLCVKASEMVNKYVSKYGRGNYPEFPHMIIDTEEQKMIAMNMIPKEKNKFLK